MKIIHVVRGNYNPNSLNGVYKVIDSISRVLHSLGNDVCVLSVSNESQDLLQFPEYKIYRVKEGALRLMITNGFKNFIDRQNKDTVYHFHSVFIPWFLPAMKYVRKHGCRCIILTPHGQYINAAMDKSLKKRLCFMFFDSKVIRLADTIHLIGATEINKYIKANNERLCLIPNGCDIVRLVSDSSIIQRKLIFGYLGRLDIKQKGLDILLKAFALYRKNGGCGVLAFGGDGHDKQILVRIAEEEGISNFVHFSGILFDDKKWKFLESLAFFLHPSNWDVIPTACMEAASCSVPLVISKYTNLGEYVERFNAGWVVDNTVKSLAQKFMEAENTYNEKTLYMEICRGASSMIEEELNWQQITKRILKELYSK